MPIHELFRIRCFCLRPNVRLYETHRQLCRARDLCIDLRQTDDAIREACDEYARRHGNSHDVNLSRQPTCFDELVNRTVHQADQQRETSQAGDVDELSDRMELELRVADVARK